MGTAIYSSVSGFVPLPCMANSFLFRHRGEKQKKEKERKEAEKEPGETPIQETEQIPFPDGIWDEDAEEAEPAEAVKPNTLT